MMTPEQVSTMMKQIHDAEDWDLGADSSRETRNSFCERVIGCAYWGHPVYNLTPDTRWHCKDPDGPSGGRPASDDVGVIMPSRKAYDFILGAGGSNYSFHVDEIGVLDPAQYVFVPAKPAGNGSIVPPVIPPAAQGYPYPDENTYGKEYERRVGETYKKHGRSFPDPNDPAAYRHFSRYGYSSRGMPAQAAIEKHIKELDDELS
jgi:hypothetical protein